MMTSTTPIDAPEFPPALPLFVLYCSPRDYPGLWVMRRWEIRHGGEHATPDVWTHPDSPEPLREHCRERGLVCMPRQPADDPVIVEVWF